MSVNASSDLNGVEADEFLARGHRLSQSGLFAEAEVCARRAVALRPSNAMGYNNLGFARMKQGDSEGAVAAYRNALQINPGLRMSRRNLALLLLKVGRKNESFALFHAEFRDAEGPRWLQERVSHALDSHDIGFAAELSAISAELRLGTAWYPIARDETLMPFPLQSPARHVTIPKLRHDIEQFQYLQRQGVLVGDLESLITAYTRVVERLCLQGAESVRIPLTDENLKDIGDTFNRIVYLRDTPRVPKALARSWDPALVEACYLDHAPGVVVVDDFFSHDALRELRSFCLESTVWSGNRYAHGRLGAFFHEGFNCPLLVQIAEELREALPRVIGERHTLSQMWSFKNAPYQPGDSTTHADFAAVNVNIWITPDKANLDPSSGGLVVYNVDAPPHWDFPTYNGRSDMIETFLERQRARTVYIPYRQNRAVIFNSDLFHGTATVRFRSEYEFRRMNVTMLYGVRADDHRQLAQPDPPSSAWRSAAFSRRRR